jgi:hypothetical protein
MPFSLYVIIKTFKKIIMVTKKKKTVKQQEAEQTAQKEQPAEKTASVKTEEKSNFKSEPSKEKKETVGKEHREPQMITINGGKVTHAHAFPSKDKPEDWYYTARLDGIQLHPMKMSMEDVTAYQNKEISVKDMMEKYYPTKIAKQVTPEQFKADRLLSDGRTIDKMNVYKEKDETKQDFGKYKLYAQVGEQKMSQLMSWKDLNAYFDRVTTPAKLVEKNFGERLHLASAYEKYKLPDGVKVSDVRVAKDKNNGRWNISVNMGERGQTDKKTLSFDDGYALFSAKTADRGQLAAKYLTKEMSSLINNHPAETQNRGIKL